MTRAKGHPRGDDHLDKLFGALIRARRVELGMSQSDVSDKIGVSFQQVQKYENGANGVGLLKLRDICAALGLKPREVLDEIFSAAPAARQSQTVDRDTLEMVRVYRSIPTQAGRIAARNMARALANGGNDARR